MTRPSTRLDDDLGSVAQVRVYYTDQWFKKRYRGERFVYHVMRYCPSGRRIKGKHRVADSLPVAGRKPCQDCTGLAEEWLSLPTARRAGL
ncbi:MAG TPA: hypothetical protein VMB82_02315 [Acidimicrobiales bacterium]|nr:hypothetical protein [Acidimicrobiales bacterium]